MKTRFGRLLFTLLLVLSAAAIPARAEKTAEDFFIKEFKKGERLVIAVIPEQNVFEQRRRYQYIADYLSKGTDLDVRIDIMPNYGDICDAFIEGRVDAGFFGSFSYALTSAKADIEPLVRPLLSNGSSTYTGYIFVRKDSGIENVKDMKGKSLALVDKVTTAGYIYPLYYFKTQNIDMEKYLSKIYFAGSHDAAAWAVYTGEADIGGAKDYIFNALAREYPDFRDKMLVLSESPEVPSNGLAVRKNLSPALKLRIKGLLLTLHESEEGRQVLKNFGAIKFIETKDKDYKLLHKMIEQLGVDLTVYPYK